MAAFSEIDYLDTETLAMLRSVYDMMLAERGIEHGGAGAEGLAERVIALYASGCMRWTHCCSACAARARHSSVALQGGGATIGRRPSPWEGAGFLFLWIVALPLGGNLPQG